MNSPKTMVFAVPRYRYMQDVICSGKQFIHGNFETGRFPNREIWRKIPEADMRAARRRKVAVLGSSDDEDFNDLLACATELARVASELHIVLVFARYATQERRGHLGDDVSAKRICEQLSNVPAPGIRKVVQFLDLHAEGMEFYCDRHQTITEHVSSRQLWCELIRANSGPGKRFGENLTVASADLGRKDTIIGMADALGATSAFVVKERTSGSETHLLGDIIGDVRGRTVLIYDDMLRSGGTILDAAEAYRSGGAAQVWVIITHPDFAGDPLARLRDAGTVDGVIFGDTYPEYSLADRYPGFAHVVPFGHFLADRWHREFGL